MTVKTISSQLMHKDGMSHDHRKGKRNLQFHDLVWLARKAKENLEPRDMKKVLHDIERFIDRNEYTREKINIELQWAEAFKALMQEKFELKNKAKCCQNFS